MRQIAILALALAASAAPGVTPGIAAVDRTAGCTAPMQQVSVGGRPGFRFCGPATAVVHLGGHTIRFRDGLCRRALGAFTVNIGTSVPAVRSGKPPYFGITTHTTKPGKQLNAAVGFAYGGHGYAVADQVVTLSTGLTGGTFSGRILGSGTTVRGSFTC
jgi:hypothetical protein